MQEISVLLSAMRALLTDSSSQKYSTTAGNLCKLRSLTLDFDHLRYPYPALGLCLGPIISALKVPSLRCFQLFFAGFDPSAVASLASHAFKQAGNLSVMHLVLRAYKDGPTICASSALARFSVVRKHEHRPRALTCRSHSQDELRKALSAFLHLRSFETYVPRLLNPRCSEIDHLALRDFIAELTSPASGSDEPPQVGSTRLLPSEEAQQYFTVARSLQCMNIPEGSVYLDPARSLLTRSTARCWRLGGCTGMEERWWDELGH